MKTERGRRRKHVPTSASLTTSTSSSVSGLRAPYVAPSGTTFHPPANSTSYACSYSRSQSRSRRTHPRCCSCRHPHTRWYRRQSTPCLRSHQRLHTQTQTHPPCIHLHTHTGIPPSPPPYPSRRSPAHAPPRAARMSGPQRGSDCASELGSGTPGPARRSGLIVAVVVDVEEEDHAVCEAKVDADGLDVDAAGWKVDVCSAGKGRGEPNCGGDRDAGKDEDKDVQRRGASSPSMSISTPISSAYRPCAAQARRAGIPRAPSSVQRTCALVLARASFPHLQMLRFLISRHRHHPLPGSPLAPACCPLLLLRWLCE
jgi:hypothetical protein